MDKVRYPQRVLTPDGVGFIAQGKHELKAILVCFGFGVYEWYELGDLEVFDAWGVFKEPVQEVKKKEKERYKVYEYVVVK